MAWVIVPSEVIIPLRTLAAPPAAFFTTPPLAIGLGGALRLATGVFTAPRTEGTEVGIGPPSFVPLPRLKATDPVGNSLPGEVPRLASRSARLASRAALMLANLAVRASRRVIAGERPAGVFTPPGAEGKEVGIGPLSVGPLPRGPRGETIVCPSFRSATSSLTLGVLDAILS